MKRQKKLLIMLAVLLVLAGTTALATYLTEAAQNVDPEEDDVVIFGITPEEVTSLSWTYGGETQEAVYENETWLGGDGSLELDAVYLDEMLTELEEVTAYRTIGEPDDLENYGLREPVCTIQVNGADDLTLFLGNETGIGGQRYASIDDGKVYLVDESVMDVFGYSLEDIQAEVEETVSGETTAETEAEPAEETTAE